MQATTAGQGSLGRGNANLVCIESISQTDSAHLLYFTAEKAIREDRAPVSMNDGSKDMGSSPNNVSSGVKPQLHSLTQNAL